MYHIKCKVCDSEMITRLGKYGEFLACPKSNNTDNHGTISLPLPFNESSILKSLNTCNINSNLDKEIDLCCAREFGFIADSTDIFMDIDLGDGQHWTDYRPF